MPHLKLAQRARALTQQAMTVRLISLIASIVGGIGAVFYIIHILQANAVQKEQLETLQSDYEQLKKIQQAEHVALIRRDQAYAQERKKYDNQIKGLEQAMASAADACIDRQLPIPVIERLRLSGENQ